jgi:chromosomal replication initiator protein
VNPDANELWQKVMASLSGKVGAQMIDKLLRPIEALDAAGGVLLLRAANDFAREWVSKAYTSAIEEQLRIVTGEPWSIHWAASVVPMGVLPKLSPAPKSPPKPPGRIVAPIVPNPPPAQTAMQHAQPSQRPIPSRTAPAQPSAARSASAPTTASVGAAVGSFSAGLSPKYTFDQFVTGPSNQVAHAMALALSNLSGRRVNVLFLCGGTGLGKTHLSNAVGHRVLEQKPDARIVYVSAETFTNEYVAAIQQRKMDEFRGRYRNQCDALLIDDVQFLAGKEGTQEEFFHTFNALYQREAAIVLTSDVLPQKLQGMAERLVSRFGSGLVAEVYTPEVETRVAILKKKAEQENVRLDDDAAFAIAGAANTSIRELEGMLMKLAIKANISGRASIDTAMVRETLRIGTKPAVVTVDDVQRAVCEHYRIKLGQLTGKDRHREVALPRQVAMFLARVHLGTSFPQIGAKFEGKDHTTVMSAVRRVEKLLPDDPELRVTIDSLSVKLGFQPPPSRVSTEPMDSDS